MRPSSFCLFLACGSVSTLALGLPSFSNIHTISRSFVSRAVHGIYGTRAPGVIKRAEGECPPVWGDIAQELTKEFLTDNECNNDARSAIRASFHDCGAWELALGETGGCDGSLVLAENELNPDIHRGNNGLRPISNKVLGWARKYNVSVADMFVFAGNHATVSCRKGPVVPTYIGRNDSSVEAPIGLLPNPRWNASKLIENFERKGFTANELVALVGAHSTSTQRGFDTNKPNFPQDSTPEIWDVKFYAETLPGATPNPNIVMFESDLNLAKDERTSERFEEFAENQENQGFWNSEYSQAMWKMTLNGVPGGIANLVDCTSFLPAPRD